MSTNISRSRLIASAAAALSLAPRVGRAQTSTLHLAGVPTDDITPIIWAMKTGMYEKAGLNLEFVPVSSGSTATTSVIGGTYELAKASPMAPILAYLHGVPIMLVANGIVSTPRTPFSAMIVASDAPIHSATDCNGRTGISPGLSDINSLAMMTWIDRNGGDSKTVKWVEVPGSAAADAVGDHRVDFALIQEPQLSEGLRTAPIRILADVYAAVSNRWITSTYLTTADFAAKNADALRRFVRVTYASAAYTNAHKSETIAVMAEMTKIAPATYTKMIRGDGATTSDPALLQPIIDMAVHYKAIDRPFPAKEMYWSG